MTKGEDRVQLRVGSEDQEDGLIFKIKKLTAQLIDLCGAEYVPDFPSEESRLWALAMTHYESAAMWAVKAATCKEE